MARPTLKSKMDAVEKENQDTPQSGPIVPFGSFWRFVQLTIDLLPKPTAARILQFVYYPSGKTLVLVSENAFHRSELIEKGFALMRTSFDSGNTNEFMGMPPHKGKIHWCEFTEEFCKTGKGPRIDPETGEATE